MTAIRLTKRAVDTLAPSSKTVIHFDKDLAGFGLRITPSGARSWIVQYRPGGGGRGQTARRMTLGSISTLTPDEARRAARDVLARARLGEDPAGTRAKDRETPTFKTFAERYLAEEAAAKLKPRTITNYRIYLLKHAAPDLGGLKLTAITSAEVGKLHRRIGKAKPIVANRVVEAVASVYRYAAAEHLVPKGYNPAAGIEAFREINRERYLSTPELERLGVTLRLAETEGLPWTVDEASPKAKHVPKSGRRTLVSASACAAIRLLLFTGCRLREILHTRWEDIDFERGLLLLPEFKDGTTACGFKRPCPFGPEQPSSGRRLCDPWRVGRDKSRKTPRRPQTAMGCDLAICRPPKGAASRFATFLCKRGRRSWPRPANRRQAPRSRRTFNDKPLCTPGR